MLHPGTTRQSLNLEDFTMGLLVRVNGGLLAQEHHLIGLQASPREQVQNMRIWLDNGGSGDFQNVSIAQGAIGAREDLGHGKTRLSVGNGEWHWAHFVFESGDEVTTYIDGEERAQFGTGCQVEQEARHVVARNPFRTVKPSKLGPATAPSLSTVSMTGH